MASTTPKETRGSGIVQLYRQFSQLQNNVPYTDPVSQAIALTLGGWVGRESNALWPQTVNNRVRNVHNIVRTPPPKKKNAAQNLTANIETIRLPLPDSGNSGQPHNVIPPLLHAVQNIHYNYYCF